MSLNYVHVVPHREADVHDTDFFSECFCVPHFKPVDGGFMMIHRDAISRKMGLHALYHNANPETWWVWREVNEGPVRNIHATG